MQDVKRSIEQNLIDAGVDADVIKKFLCLEEQHNTAEQLKILSEHYETLLTIG